LPKPPEAARLRRNAGGAGEASRSRSLEETVMQMQLINAPDAPQPVGGYNQAVAVTGAQKLLFVSGQIPVDTAGQVPEGFSDQARLAWRNVEAQLRAAGMGLADLVKVTVFLSDRRHALENRQVRREILGDRAPAMTVIIASIFDAAWLLEIEAVAAA
jgi:enamine deaminase RidA (YjgF/YER057c/UK114 family)